MRINLQLLIIILIMSLSFSFASDTVPVNTTSTSTFDLIGIGAAIEKILLIPFKNIEDKMTIIGGRKTSSIAENIFIVLFMLETAYTLSSQYLEGSIEKIPTTFVVRAFFGSCVLGLIHNGLIFGIIGDIMTSLVKGIGSPPNFSWFNDGQFNTIITSLTKNGVLTRLDTLFNNVLTALDILHIKNIGQLALIVCVCSLMVKIYIEGFKIVLGMFIKGIEWCFGLPVAMIMLGMKGSKITEEYFDIAVRYIYRTALDFTITIVCIDIGSLILTEAVKQNTTEEGLTGSLITVFSFLIAFAIWKTLLFGAETLIIGISSGSPAFTAAQAAGIISNLASAAKSSANLGLTPVRAGVSGIISKARGGTFTEGALKSLGNDVKGFGVGLASSDAWKNTNEGMKKIQKIDENGRVKEVWATGDANTTSGLNSIMSDYKNISDSKKRHINRVKDVNKFEEKHKISEAMMKKMGYHTVAQRDDFMNRHNKLTEMKQDLDDFKISTTQVNSKGKSINREISDIQKELAEKKQDATIMNSTAQINKSSNSALTRQMEDSLLHHDNSDDKIAILKTWLKTSQKDPINFSIQKFNNNLDKLTTEIKYSSLPQDVKNNQLNKLKNMLVNAAEDPNSKNLNFDKSFEEIQFEDKNGDILKYSVSEVEMESRAEENQMTYNNFLTSAINSI